jgi:hypothetical protein
MNLRLIDRGIIEPAPSGADIGAYVMSGGKNTNRPTEATSAERPTLGTPFDGYLAFCSKAAKEATTWKTVTIHIEHLRRLLDVRLFFSGPATAGTIVSCTLAGVGLVVVILGYLGGLAFKVLLVAVDTALYHEIMGTAIVLKAIGADGPTQP